MSHSTERNACFKEEVTAEEIAEIVGQCLDGQSRSPA